MEYINDQLQVIVQFRGDMSRNGKGEKWFKGNTSFTMIWNMTLKSGTIALQLIGDFIPKSKKVKYNCYL